MDLVDSAKHEDGTNDGAPGGKDDGSGVHKERVRGRGVDAENISHLGDRLVHAGNHGVDRRGGPERRGKDRIRN